MTSTIAHNCRQPKWENSDSQDPGVLVPGVQVPAKYSRNYQSVPQHGLNGRSSPVYTAAVVGGGTVVNGMFFNRGSAGDYDAWERLGNPGWAWKDLLPYFKKVCLLIVPMEFNLKYVAGIIERDFHAAIERPCS